MWNKIVGSIAGLLVMYMTYVVITFVIIIGSTFIVGDNYTDTITAIARILGFVLGGYLFVKVYNHQVKSKGLKS